MEDSIWNREVYKSIFGHYPDGDHEVLDAVQGGDGVYRVPLPEDDPLNWKYYGFGKRFLNEPYTNITYNITGV